MERDFSLGGEGNLSLGWQFNDWVYGGRRKVLNRSLRRFRIRPNGARVLDIVFGTGFCLNYWLKRNVSAVMGVDFRTMAVDKL